MIDVLLQGGSHNLFPFLCRGLSQIAPITAAGVGVFLRQEKSSFFLWEGPIARRVLTPHPLLVLSEPFPAGRLPDICPNGVAVVDSRQQGWMEAFSGSQTAVITCGLKNSDTLTFSSFTGDSVVVSLQRSITTFSGGKVEPGEYPLALSGQWDPFCILALCAICLLGDLGEALEKITC